MKTKIVLVLFVLLIAASGVIAADDSANAGCVVQISYVGLSGAELVSAEIAGSLLTERLSEMGAPAKSVQIKLILDSSLQDNLTDEGYRIEANGSDVKISSASAKGIIYGAARFIEWVIGETTPDLVNKKDVDVDFPVQQGQAVDFLSNMPKTKIEEKPYFPIRVIELTNLSMGVADLIDTPKGVEKYNNYSKIEGPYRPGTAETWKQWCDWAARHKQNYISNWPYSAGTNWWEMAIDPATEGMTIYSNEEIRKAAAVRDDLFKYARARGLKPMLLNYIAGAPTESIKKAHPEIIGTSSSPHYPAPFCLSTPATKELFVTQIKAIMNTYPNLAGLHLRWWGESFPCVCEECQKNNIKKLQFDITQAVLKAAREVRPDCELIVSGFFRYGGTKEFAWETPEDTIIQSKWGIDWEPTSDPNIPFDWIEVLDRPFLISEALPCEEMQSIGGTHCIPYRNGVMKYVNAHDQMPNLSGFANVVGEKDHEWITETNHITFAKLNWDPKGSDIEALLKNYIVAHYGADTVDEVFEAILLSEKSWETYCIKYAGIAPFADCARTHGAFGLQIAERIGPASLKKSLDEVIEYADNLSKAVRLLESVESNVKQNGLKSFNDLMIQTKWFADWFKSRQLLASAYLDMRNGDIDGFVRKLRAMRALDRNLLALAEKKPNISDYFEMEGMDTAVNIPPAINSELKQIEQKLQPEYLEYLRQHRILFGSPDQMDIIGPVGKKVDVVFEIPETAGELKAMSIEFQVVDVDGNKPGQEAIVKYLGEEFLVPPTGDGQAKNMIIELDVTKIKPGDPVVAEFLLAGKPGGTSGYYVRGCRLNLKTE